MCCGQKRSALRRPAMLATPRATWQRTAESPRPNAPQPTSQASPAGGPSVSLRYLKAAPLQMRGPVTGWKYEFSSSHPVQAVDPRDAAVLLRTRFFHTT